MVCLYSDLFLDALCQGEDTFRERRGAWVGGWEKQQRAQGAGKGGLAPDPCGHPQGRRSLGTPRRQGTRTRLQAGWPWRQRPCAFRGASGEANKHTYFLLAPILILNKQFM